MGRSKEILDDELIRRAREEFKCVKDEKVRVRLRAIISSGDHNIKDVAAILGVCRQTIWGWIKDFKSKGIEGLKDKPRGHRLAKINEEQRIIIRQWLYRNQTSAGKDINWTIAKLQTEIRSVFGIQIGRTPLWLLIKKLGVRTRRRRPCATDMQYMASAVQ